MAISSQLNFLFCMSLLSEINIKNQFLFCIPIKLHYLCSAFLCMQTNNLRVCIYKSKNYD